MVTTTLGEFDTIEASGFNNVKMEWLLALHTPMLLFIANSETQHDVYSPSCLDSRVAISFLVWNECIMSMCHEERNRVLTVHECLWDSQMMHDCLVPDKACRCVTASHLTAETLNP